MRVEEYLSLFPGKTREKERFMALAEALLQQVVDLAALTEEIHSGFSFFHAEGKQLNDIAAALGLDRADTKDGSGCRDEVFRKYLQAKLALWIWDGTNEKVPVVLGLALPGSSMTDNGDGTVTVTPGEELPAKTEQLFPIPAGVMAVTEEQEELE